GRSRGTSLNHKVTEDDTPTCAMLDGEIQPTNQFMQVTLKSGEGAVSEPGKPPRGTPMLEAINNIIQWCLYYPAILDADELKLSDGERQALSGSLEAYRKGDLLTALSNYPQAR